MRRKVEVIPHQVSWAKEFEKEKKILAAIFAEQLIAVEHIGSTAIKKSKAKPIIDLLVVVKDIEKIDRYNKYMEEAGYECFGEYGIKQRRFFSKGGIQHSHHVHVFPKGNPEISRHIAFREYLNAHPDEALAYSRLKEALAAQYPYDIQRYVEGKAPFIQAINQKALSWYRSEQHWL